MLACALQLRLSAVTAPGDQHRTAPAITVTEDNSLPVDDDDFVEYYGLQAYVEGITRPRRYEKYKLRPIARDV